MTTLTISSPISAYLVKIVYRAHSTGSEQWVEQTCLSLEGASKFMTKQLSCIAEDYNYPEEWDKDDMSGAEWPSDDIFSVENLKIQLKKNEKYFGYDTAIWGPYSLYEAQSPIEFFLKMTTIYP